MGGFRQGIKFGLYSDQIYHPFGSWLSLTIFQNPFPLYLRETNQESKFTYEVSSLSYSSLLLLLLDGVIIVDVEDEADEEISVDEVDEVEGDDVELSTGFHDHNPFHTFSEGSLFLKYVLTLFNKTPVVNL